MPRFACPGTIGAWPRLELGVSGGAWRTLNFRAARLRELVKPAKMGGDDCRRTMHSLKGPPMTGTVGSAPLALDIFMRWLHIGAATLAIGVPIYVRFVAMPAIEEIPDEAIKKALRERLNARWRKFVMVMITLLLISGVYWLLYVVNLKRKPALYHALLGVKILAAFGLFFLASALAGRSKAFEHFRVNAKKWVTVNVALGIIILLCAGIIHMLPNKPLTVVPNRALNRLGQNDASHVSLRRPNAANTNR